MSAEDSAAQAPAQAPATFSSFINKNTSGKKFAPKAARRRPGAAAASATKPAASVADSAPSTATPQASHAEPSSSNIAAAVPAVPAQLPTPAPTQEPNTQDAPQAAPAPAEPSSATATAVQETPVTAPAPEPATAPTPAVLPTQPARQTQHVPQTSTQPDEDDIEAGRSPKRRRIESPPRQSTPMMPVAVMVAPQQGQSSDDIPPRPLMQPETASSSTDIPLPTDPEAATGKRTRRKLPWTAVNHPHEDGGETIDEAPAPPAKKKRAPPKARGKKATETEAEAGEQQDHSNEEDARPTQQRPSAKARGKRRADAPEIGEDGEPVEPPAKKPRKPRKDKGKERAEDGEQVEGDTGEEPSAAAKPNRKPRAPRKKKSTSVEGEDGSTEPKRKGRPPREDTPPEAEDQTIDPDAVCMDDLASRNIRVGKLSRREREMRKIDWDAVRARRREEDARHISTKETQAAVDKLLEAGEVQPETTGPRYHVVDGRIELIHDSGTIDRERDADREIDAMVITEEDDLTTRITTRSFMKNNKRFPNDFVLPGQGKRWTPQSTQLFYQGLRSFGTDFQMITHMFPGMTRRSIKTKFTREEKENPDIIRECLRGKSQLVECWDEFLEVSQLEENSFVDADKIKGEMEEEERVMREKINEALAEKRERDRQRIEAGVGEEGDPAAEKGKGRKRAKKDKSVAFVEEGVEILGAVDDDPGWGVE